jgi:transposase
MLWESSKMEQRYDDVLGIQDGTFGQPSLPNGRDGYTFTEVAKKFRVSHQSLHTWMMHSEAGGPEALVDRSSKLSTSLAQIAGEIEARILELRRHQPGWDPMHLR